MRARALLVILPVFAGCAAVETAPPVPVRAAAALPASSAEELLGYLARLRALDEAELAAEASRLRELAKRQPTPMGSLKLALALAASPQGDETETLAIIEPLSRNGLADPGVSAMASFLQGVVVERRRLKDSAASAGSKAQSERRAVETQKQRADALQERNAQLQQKIDALTELEKSLSSRPPQGK